MINAANISVVWSALYNIMCYYIPQDAVIKRGGVYHGFNLPQELKLKLHEGKASFMAPTYTSGFGQYGLRPGTDILMSRYTGYAYRLGHPLKDHFDDALSQLQESGVLRHLREKYKTLV